MQIQFSKPAARVVAVTAATAAGLLGFAPAMAAPADSIIPVPCSVVALVAAISTAPSGSVLVLASQCTYTLDEPLPTINDTLIFEGSLTTTIARSTEEETPSFTIMTVGDGGNVTTDEVNFTNGDSSDDGVDGGAIYNSGGQVYINYGTFSDNNAEEHGGAIYSSDGLLKVNGALFVDNTAGFGAGIYNNGVAVITGARFQDNDADQFGGGIENHARTSVATSTFAGNRAVDGGGIYNAAGTTTVGTSDFEDNLAGEGGAIENEASISLASDNFDSNGNNIKPSVVSGVVRNGTDAPLAPVVLTTVGGGVYNDSTMTLAHSTFTGNEAVQGGGLYNEGTATMSSDTFTDNSATHFGGGIDNEDTSTLTASDLHGNNAGMDGGGIYNEFQETITNTEIHGNHAVHDGGGIYNEDSVTLSSTAVVSNTPNNCAPPGSVAGCIG